MRIKAKRGSLSSGLGIMGSGLTAAFPIRAVGITLVIIGLFVFVFDIEIEFADGRFKIHDSIRKHKMIPLIGMVICALGFIGFSTWYWWPDPSVAMKDTTIMPTASTTVRDTQISSATKTTSPPKPTAPDGEKIDQVRLLYNAEENTLSEISHGRNIKSIIINKNMYSYAMINSEPFTVRVLFYRRYDSIFARVGGDAKITFSPKEIGENFLSGTIIKTPYLTAINGEESGEIYINFYSAQNQ